MRSNFVTTDWVPVESIDRAVEYLGFEYVSMYILTYLPGYVSEYLLEHRREREPQEYLINEKMTM
jgi:hypothetical protein